MTRAHRARIEARCALIIEQGYRSLSPMPKPARKPLSDPPREYNKGFHRYGAPDDSRPIAEEGRFVLMKPRRSF